MGRKHTTRHKTRRQLEGCAHLCDNINEYLAEIDGKYGEDYPDISNTLLEIGRIIEAARILMLELRKSI